MAALPAQISLVATVLNEGDNIQRLMESLLLQTRLPDEIVIVDGGSQDDTVAILRRYMDRLPLQVLVVPGCSISAGRNHAIHQARGDVIAVTDAGVWLEHNWLEELTKPLLVDPSVAVSSGFFRAEPFNTFEAAMGATVLPLLDEIEPEHFLPSHRSAAFLKSAWEQAGGYPEWLDYCEDLVLDLKLKYCAARFAFAPGAVVRFRPRRSLAGFFRQYYLYARGDGKAGLWFRRHFIRYLTYLVAAPFILALGLVVHPLLWTLYVPGAAVYLYQPYRRLPVVLRSAPSHGLSHVIVAALFVPVIRITGDIAKMLGYPVGVRWRLQHHPPDWRSCDKG